MGRVGSRPSVPIRALYKGLKGLGFRGFAFKGP